jgi:putative nucleotidyltransferase with HDIG domain
VCGYLTLPDATMDPPPPARRALQSAASLLGVAEQGWHEVALLADTLAQDYEQFNFLYETIDTVRGVLDLAEVLECIHEQSAAVIDLDGLYLFRRDGDADALALLAAWDGRTWDLPQILPRGADRVSQAFPDGEVGIFNHLSPEQAQQVFPDPLNLGPRSILLVPLDSPRRRWGLLVVTRQGEAEFRAGDEKLLGSLAKVWGMALENAHLHARTKTVWEDTIRAFVSALDGRDPHTLGHSQRVSAIAVRIARRMGWPEDDLEGLRIAGLMHDIGKLTTYDGLLWKPGRLTPNEFALVKEHPALTSKILSEISFPWPVAEMAGAHHERMDGTGYPRGLRGEEIPLGGRIIAVADFYDALTSNRTYRPGLSRTEALEIMEKARGSHLDPQVLEAFFEVLREEGVTE